jgi:hypothetical protein
MSLDGSTPGADRLITFTVRDNEFRVRRPFRSDEAEIRRRFARKLTAGGTIVDEYPAQRAAQDVLNAYDGVELLAEARFEVLLSPRRRPNGEEERAGESCPEHWRRRIFDGERLIAESISFDGVDPDEFREAAAALDQALQKKTASESPSPESSTDSAKTPSSG